MPISVFLYLSHPSFPRLKRYLCHINWISPLYAHASPSLSFSPSNYPPTHFSRVLWRWPKIADDLAFACNQSRRLNLGAGHWWSTRVHVYGPVRSFIKFSATSYNTSILLMSLCHYVIKMNLGLGNNKRNEQKESIEKDS